MFEVNYGGNGIERRQSGGYNRNAFRCEVNKVTIIPTVVRDRARVLPHDGPKDGQQ